MPIGGLSDRIGPSKRSRPPIRRTTHLTAADEDVFVHMKALNGAEWLDVGAQVEYETSWDDRKGKMACSSCTGGSGGGGGGGGGGGYGKSGGGGGGGKGGSPYGGKGGGKGKGKW